MSAIIGLEVKRHATCLVGGQAGSEGKGAAAAWVAYELAKEGRKFDIVTTNAGAQAGHTSIHKGRKRVVFHLPTAPLIAEDELGANCGGVAYLNAGSIIDVTSFEKELNDTGFNGPIWVHPMAAIITDECREAELDPHSSRTKIASTRKGVGEALSRKVMRSGVVARDVPFMKQFIREIDLNQEMRNGASVLVEIPQGVSLSLNHSGFYPYTTSRDCTPMAGLSDAAIVPQLYNTTMVVLRTRPIKVGNIVEEGKTIGYSGPSFDDQKELTWEEVGVEAEITTVTKRVRRVFSFSKQQLRKTLALCDPDYVYLTFCDYIGGQEANEIVQAIYDITKELGGPPPKIIFQWGPTTADVGEEYVAGRS